MSSVGRLPQHAHASPDCKPHDGSKDVDLTAGHAQPVLFDVIENNSQGLAHTSCGPLPQQTHASSSQP
eukprot:11569085-Karenia_brevis.AAC.1